MKSLQSPELASPEFKGRTPDEAIANARSSLGENVPVRCWKVRTRGAFGFFAKECFIAGTVPPVGVGRIEEPIAPRIANSKKDRGEIKPSTQSAQKREKDAQRVSKEPFADLIKMFSGSSRNAMTEKSSSNITTKSLEKPSFLHKQQAYGQKEGFKIKEYNGSLSGGLSIEDLVADTKDEVLLGTQSRGDIDFSAILREAEATIQLAMSDQLDIASPSVIDSFSDNQPYVNNENQIGEQVQEEVEDQIQDQVDLTQLDRSSELASAFEIEVGSDLIKPDLVETDEVSSIATCLRNLGVAQDYFSDESAILDSLVRSISNLPKARELPRTGGSVIAVIGNKSLIEGVAASVATHLGLTYGDVLHLDRTNAAKQRVTKRKATKKVTIVAIEAPLRARELEEISSWVEMLNPDYVLGAVSASAKRSDVVNWFQRMRLVDSLAIANLTSTSTPFEILGQLPVLFIENYRASTLRWVSIMFNTLTEEEI